MSYSHLLRILIALAALVVLLAACGGDGTGTDEASPTDEQAGADEATSSSQDGADGDDGGEGVDQSDAFADLASRGFASAARVTYEMASEGSETQTLVLSSDGEQTAWIMPDARMIARADGTQIFCDESAQQAQCFQMTGEQGPAGAMAAATPFLGLATSFQEGVASFPGFVSTGEQEIAGRTATCGRFDPSRMVTGEDAGEATLCVDTDTGVMLRYEATSPQGGTSSLTAVEFGEPRASDFEPPAEPMQMDMGG